jgi:hypothetical protein
MRILATHAAMNPLAPETTAFFEAIKADPIYVRMCKNQRCFRARLTAKPWRIGLETHLKPQPGVWPIDASRMPARLQWVAEYERRAAYFAACHFVESIGSGKVDFELRRIIDFHDAECHATRSNLQLA